MSNGVTLTETLTPSGSVLVHGVNRAGRVSECLSPSTHRGSIDAARRIVMSDLTSSVALTVSQLISQLSALVEADPDVACMAISFSDPSGRRQLVVATPVVVAPKVALSIFDDDYEVLLWG